MGTPNSRPQILQSAELKLFHCALAAPKLLCHFTGTFLLYKPVHDDKTLVSRKAVDELEQHGPPFSFVQAALVRCIPPGIHLLF
jgi:hypothetical protein